MGNAEFIVKLDDLTSTIIGLGNKINSLSSASIPPPPSFNFLSDRQIAKRIIMAGGNRLGSSEVQVDEKIAHLTVYGKLLFDTNGRLIEDNIRFPECLAKSGEGEGGINFMADTSPMLEDIKNMKNEFNIAIAGLRIKGGEIFQAFIDMNIQLVLAVTTLASCVTIMPPGSGLPTAVSTIKAIPAAFLSFQTRLIQIIPFLKPLSYVTVLVGEQANALISALDSILLIFKTPFEIIDTVLGLVTALAGSTPPVPGVGNAPPEPMEVKPTAEPEIISFYESGLKDIILKANASKGSWKFTYNWSSDTGRFSSIGEDKKEVVDRPSVTTKYTVTVTDSNGDSKSSDVMVLVGPM